MSFWTWKPRMADTPPTGSRKPGARLGRGLDSLTAGGKLRPADQEINPDAAAAAPHPALAQPRDKESASTGDAGATAENSGTPDRSQATLQNAGAPLRDAPSPARAIPSSGSAEEIERLRRDVQAAQRHTEIAQQVAGEARIQLVLMLRRQRVWATAVLALLTLLGLLVWWASAEIQRRQQQIEQLQAWGGAGSAPESTAEQGELTGVEVAALRSERDRLRSELGDTRKALEAANATMDELARQGRGKPAGR